MREPRYIEAVYALAGKNCIGGNVDGPISEITFVEDYTPPTEANIQTKLTELQSAYTANQYQRDRQTEYDALNQFELMTDDAANGTTTHADAIAAIKTKYPKP